MAAAVDGMVETAAFDLQAALGEWLRQHLPHEILRGRGKIFDEPLIGNTERRAGLVGRRSKMGVGGKQHDLRRQETMRREAGMNGLLQLGADDHEVEAEDHAAPPACFEQHRRYLDCVEDSRDRRLARRIASEPHRSVARGDVAICGSCKHDNLDRDAALLAGMPGAASNTRIPAVGASYGACKMLPLITGWKRRP
jgi:hypothetical protein